MTVRWTRSASDDLDGIVRWIAADRPGAAARVADGIASLAAALPDHPRRGRAGRVPGTREAAIAGLPYLLVYEADEDGAVTILRVLHGARRWPS